MPHRVFDRQFCLIVVLCLTASVSKASITFLWPTGGQAGWHAGAPAPGNTATQSFTDPNSNNLTVSVNNNGTSSTGATWQGGYPQISRAVTGGFSNVQALQLYASAQASTSSYIRTTVTFSTPVINLSFQIWDVDAIAGQFVDTISNIQALAQGGGAVGASSVTSVNPAYNTITGTGLSTVVMGTANAANNTNQGSINVTFAGPITQFSFDWSNTDAALGKQEIALGPLTYEPVPEVDSSMSIAAVCLSAILGEKLRRRSRKTPRLVTKS